MRDRSGTISFHDKVLNCEKSNGLGAVIINNVAGMLYGTLGDTNATTIPAVGAALEDRSALLAASNGVIDIGTADYGFMSGTSMATPAVSGVAALVWSNHPTCTGEQIRSALRPQHKMRAAQVRTITLATDRESESRARLSDRTPLFGRWNRWQH